MDFDQIFICTTDTVTGLGGPVNQNTLDCIYHLKNRPLSKKVMILVGSIEQARKFKQWNDKADKFALKYWPGAYSLVINNQGFRMPNNDKLCEFLTKNGPMYVTSANISGEEPINIEDAHKIFPTVKNIYNFGQGSEEASKIFDLDTNKWLR
ncbi:Sua5/YciO/YrdC/YwlC family protein [Mycoplasma sp. U97]|uniref:L-threonylcarbamoyladenylate synthase n=2 Tax=Mycoplasma tauri TaxID=547987 RepID=A0A953T741_9MOLU|nr:Sua5/YciO/YrdC/YwlC family protein [Mycoplasma tauri]MBZ4195257.1 Sua5/YciO/YrdC/YwlC family protein [Mycoplasma tauri]MBZ4212578.1 Sua5/YciO/YrdC/YwlC family protein [Mycoplasma tauri]QSB07312.1 Sua5/YciO/YrdC/YwlC family protein [Mycoplasma tauri]